VSTLDGFLMSLDTGDGGAGNSRNGYGRKSVVTDTGRMARSTTLVSISMRPSSRKALRPSQ